MKICSKIGCKNLGIVRIKTYNRPNNLFYCNKHYRFQCMRHGAQQKGKSIPLYTELENLMPDNMICSICDQKMIWHSKYGDKNSVISLQHNNNGTIILICMACNNGHGHSKLKDKYFDIKKNNKFCPDCDLELNIKQFSIHHSRINNIQGICKNCNKKRQKLYYEKQKDNKNIRKSHYVGIYKIRKQWIALIKKGINGKQTAIFRKKFKTEEQAAIARDEFIIDNKLNVTKYKLNYPMDFYD